jgi:hypothetical protein
MLKEVLNSSQIAILETSETLAFMQHPSSSLKLFY